MHSSIPALALLAFGVSAEQTTPPSFKYEDSFQLIARLVQPSKTNSKSLNVNGLRLSSGHTGAGIDTSVLIPATGGPLGLKPDTYYGNNTGTGAATVQGPYNTLRLTPGSQYPYAMTINGAPTNASGGELSVNIGSGTPGIRVSGPYTGPVFADTQPRLTYALPGSYGPGFWTVCEGSFYQYQVPLVFWRNASTPLADNCAVIKLLPQCEGAVAAGDVSPDSKVQKSFCYDNAETVALLPGTSS